MTAAPPPPDEPQPRDIAVEQPMPDQLEELERRSAGDPERADRGQA